MLLATGRCPAGKQAELRSSVAGVQLFTDTEQADIREVVAQMACTAISDEFEGVEREDRDQVARCWLAVEDDSEATDETMDMVLAGEEDDA